MDLPTAGDTMVVHVKFFPTLANLSKSKRADFDLDWREGLTPKDILMDEGFKEVDIEACMAVINDAQARMADAISDGDRVELRVNVQGGC